MSVINLNKVEFSGDKTVSILLTWDIKSDTSEEILLAELDKLETLVLIELTSDQGSNFSAENIYSLF